MIRARQEMATVRAEAKMDKERLEKEIQDIGFDNNELRSERAELRGQLAGIVEANRDAVNEISELKQSGTMVTYLIKSNEGLIGVIERERTERMSHRPWYRRTWDWVQSGVSRAVGGIRGLVRL